MKKDFWYPTAFSGWGDEEHAAMARVIESNCFTMGQETEAFEQELASFNQRKHAICVNSGSSANLIAVEAIQLYAGSSGAYRSAAVPALAWGTTYAPLVQHGFHLELFDCDDTWCAIDYEKEEHMLVTCSILGNPAHHKSLEASDLNDDCEAFGATINGRPTASFGTVATQSFFWSHQLGAIEGGAVLTDDDELANVARSLRDHGLTRHDKGPKTFDKEYEFIHFGYNVRPVEMHMAIAREQLKKASIFRTARRKNWFQFTLQASAAGLESHLRMPLLNDGANPFGIHFEVGAQSVRTHLASTLREAGIDCRLPTGGSFRLHPYSKPWKDQETPRADQIHRTGMFIGNAPYDLTNEIERVVDVMKEFFA